MANSTPVANYSNIADIKGYWINTIAPQYFDLNNINNYNVGMFGYINEIMANTTEDAFNASAIARREFYPVTAQFISSLYAMATLQSIQIPLTTPAKCKCALILPQQEIIDNSTFNDGIYECVIDSSLSIFAGEMQFMLDYPIKILSKKTDKWSHTVHYDISVANSLNTTSNARYISTKIIKENGINYVALFIDTIRQLEMREISNIIIKDSIMDTISLDIDFDGNLANFEVFYKEGSESAELQLSKIMINASLPSTPYVQYELINPNRIRLTFTYNAIFNPKYNSEIICRVYTSMGKNGNFNSFADDLVCSSTSEKYPYNANMTIIGKVNGSAIGGADQMLTTEFRDVILKAYSTNNTITTSHDLQLQFDDIAKGITDVKVLFSKKRDDAFVRLFGAYSVMKDPSKNIIPTNTLQMEFLKSDFISDATETATRLSIPPGTVFEYVSDDRYEITPSKNDDGSLKSLLDITKEKNSSKLYFTNPFLIGINLSPNNVGYYMNSIDQYMSIEYTYVNDSSTQQFIGGTTSVYRNSIKGSNYYKFKIQLAPASDIEVESTLKINDPALLENQIRAKYNGRIVGEEYYFDTTINQGYVRFIIKYDTTVEAEQIVYIQASNTLPINRKSVTGYDMKYAVGEYFTKNDILATKKPDDLGNLVICGDLNQILLANKYYIAFSIQGFNDELKAYVMEAYIATRDEIDLAEKLTITHGIFDIDGNERKSLAIAMKDRILEMNVLYNNDGKNIPHKYSSFAGLNNFTLTNTYITDENTPFDLIGTLQFIRGTVSFLPGGTIADDYKIIVAESPVIGALWGATESQYDYFVSKYAQIDESLRAAYYLLENNFSIDSKFYNTYGKARFYTVGNQVDSMRPLDSVKCRFRFGISLNTVSSTDQFITSFRNFVKDYIETDNKITTSGQDLYIMNMISEIKKEFIEIAYIEYYGFNSYDYMAQKIIGPELTNYQEGFIPEFLNLETLFDVNGIGYPNISVSIL